MVAVAARGWRRRSDSCQPRDDLTKNELRPLCVGLCVRSHQRADLQHQSTAFLQFRPVPRRRMRYGWWRLLATGMAQPQEVSARTSFSQPTPSPLVALRPCLQANRPILEFLDQPAPPAGHALQGTSPATPGRAFADSPKQTGVKLESSGF